MKKTLILLILLFSVSSARAELTVNGFLRVAMPAGPTALDPFYKVTEENLQVAHLLFDAPVRWDGNLNIEYRLAERLERISPNVWRVHLRRGVIFHSGNPMTAEDVLWTFRRAKKSREFKVIFSDIKEATIIDDYTVDLRTAIPCETVPNILTYLFVMDSLFYTGVDSCGNDKGILNSHSGVADARHPVSGKSCQTYAHENSSGTGPFVINHYEPGKLLEMKSFDQYWGLRGNVRTLHITPIASEYSRVAALMLGQVDFVMPIPPQDYLRLHASPEFHFYSKESVRVIMLLLNMQHNPALENKLLRQTIAAAIDNTSIVKNILNGSTLPTQQFPAANMPGYVPALKPRYDLYDARELLHKAGYGDKSLSLTMAAPNNRYMSDEKIAMSIAGMLQKIGISVELKTMPRAEFWPVLRERKVDMVLVGWQPDTLDTSDYFESLLMCENTGTGDGVYNFGGYCSPELDDYVSRAKQEADPAKRAELLAQAVQLAYDDVALIPLHYEPYSWAASKRVINASGIVSGDNFAQFGNAIILDVRQ